MTQTPIPTGDDLLEGDDYTEIASETVDTWRWGTVERDVFKRTSDGTYWASTYRVSTDGETNELRDGDAHIVQVEPYERTLTDYRPVNQPA